FPYVSHTTASDALWMGVPILTLPGLGFASRVCASIVSSVGLPDLICDTPDDYVARAIHLGNHPEEVRKYKDFLELHRKTSVLFDTQAMVRRLEGLFRAMWDDYARGELPIPDLRNLPRYRLAGMRRDHENLPEVETLSAYEQSFQQILAY